MSLGTANLQTIGRPVATEQEAERGSGRSGSPEADATGSGEGRFFAGRSLEPLEVLRWIYVARVALAGGLFAAAALSWSVAPPGYTLAASLILVLTLLITPVSYWHSHVRRKEAPEASFVYSQAIYDVLLVTTIVHLTGGNQSVVAPTYILLISAYTLMLPLRGALLVAGLSCMGYIADVVWGHGTDVDTALTLQLGIFVAVALVAGLIGTKLREETVEKSTLEHQLEQLRLDTSDILGSLSTAVLTIDGRGHLAYANPAAEELLELDAADRTDGPFLEELDGVAPDLHRILERTQRYGVSVASAEISILRKGERIPVGISTTVLERRVGFPWVTAIMRDISDRKRIQELRTRAERLEAVAELSASLAHEIKNPLASIRSSVQQLGLRDGSNEDDRLLSELVQRESDRLSRLLSEFIDFARVRLAQADRLDLREVVHEAVEVVRQHPSYRAEVTIELDLDDEPVEMEADRDLLHRVVSNLVLNAVQAAEPGGSGRVRVTARHANSGQTPRGLEVTRPVLLRVSDDGPGIPEGALERIFDPFYSGRPGGTGLGLAVVHRAVEAHRGTILVESDPDEGTRFTIYLPATPPTRPEQPREA